MRGGDTPLPEVTAPRFARSECGARASARAITRLHVAEHSSRGVSPPLRHLANLLGSSLRSCGSFCTYAVQKEPRDGVGLAFLRPAVPFARHGCIRNHGTRSLAGSGHV